MGAPSSLITAVTAVECMDDFRLPALDTPACLAAPVTTAALAECQNDFRLPAPGALVPITGTDIHGSHLLSASNIT